MNETTINNFISITNSDRRTACYCLNTFHGNLEVAISFFFDEGGNIRIPSTFSLYDFENSHGLRHSAPPPIQQGTSPRAAKPEENKSTQNIPVQKKIVDDKYSKFERKYEVEDPINIPSFLKRNKPKNPEVFFPNPQIPHILNDQLPIMKKDRASHLPTMPKPALTEVKDVPYFCITLFSNGILLHDNTFISKDDARYDEIYKSLEKCEIPSLYPDDSDIEFINKSKDEYVCKN